MDHGKQTMEEKYGMCFTTVGHGLVDGWDGMGYKRPWPVNLASSFSFHSFFFSIAFFFFLLGSF